MALLSGGGGDDRLQVGMAVFAIVISMVVSLMVPIVAPAYDVDTGYSFEDIYLQKASLQAYTGESMTNMTPWALTGVYTPWSPGDPVNIDSDTGWAYGESVNYSRTGSLGNTAIGSTSPIYLDPEQKSSKRLTQETVTVPVKKVEWWASNLNGDLSLLGWYVNAYSYLLGWGQPAYRTDQVDVNSWDYTGYRYEFDPLLKIDYDDPDAPNYSKISQSDAKLSLIWYQDSSGQGISSGLILYRNTSEALISHLSIQDILKDYNTVSGYTTKYQLDYNGVYVYLNIRFDPEVLQSGTDLTKAFNDGRWSLAVTAKSMDNFMDISSSNSLSNSAANILDTYINIFTLSLPNVPFYWSVVLWLITILPMEITVLMFLSRFGVVGVGIGILATALLGVLGGA